MFGGSTLPHGQYQATGYTIAIQQCMADTNLMHRVANQWLLDTSVIRDGFRSGRHAVQLEHITSDCMCRYQASRDVRIAATWPGYPSNPSAGSILWLADCLWVFTASSVEPPRTPAARHICALIQMRIVQSQGLFGEISNQFAAFPPIGSKSKTPGSGREIGL
jgi:hypothetical protein